MNKKYVLNMDSVYFWLIALLFKSFLFRTMILQSFTIQSVIADLLFVSFIILSVSLITSTKIRSILYFIISFLVSLIWLSASVYYNYYGSIPTYLTLTSLGQVGQIGNSIYASFEPYLLLYLVDLLIYPIVVFSINKWRRSRSNMYRLSRKQWKPNKVVLMIGIVAVMATSHSLVTQASSITNEKELARTLGLFQYQLAFREQYKEKEPEQQLTDQELAYLRQEIRDYVTDNKEMTSLYEGVGKGMNVISIQLEAMQNFVIGLEVNGQEVTPFLNQLAADHFYFKNIYQQIGEGNTSDAEFIANTGAYPQGNLAMSKLVGGKIVESLPRVLAKQGYQSYTFHVNDVSFWQRNELYPALGFHRYYDKPFFNNDNFNFFGASDEELYRVTFEQLQQRFQENEAFYAHIIATSGHHPFEIPEQHRKLILPDNLSGTQLGHYLQAMHYVDNQLQIFIEKLGAGGMLEESILMIYGDHFGLQPKDNDPAWVSEVLGIPYHDTISRFNIPFIMAIPQLKGETIETVGGQVDMLPTLLNILGINTSQEELIVFGNDLLNAESNIIGIRYYMPTGTFINDEVLYIPGATFEEGKAIDLNTFEEVEEISSLKDDYNYIIELMKLSDRYTSHYIKQDIFR